MDTIQLTDSLDAEQLTASYRQYETYKRQYPDVILLFQVGQFFEAFHADAVALAKICGTAITSRNKDAETVPLSGIPADRLDHYLQVLVRAGKRVAVCEQFMPKHSIGVNWAARKV